MLDRDRHDAFDDRRSQSINNATGLRSRITEEQMARDVTTFLTWASEPTSKTSRSAGRSTIATDISLMASRATGESSGGATIRVAGFAGSLRKASFNRALLRAAIELGEEEVAKLNES